MSGLEPISDCAWVLGGGENPAMDVIKLIAVCRRGRRSRESDRVVFGGRFKSLYGAFERTTQSSTTEGSE